MCCIWDIAIRSPSLLPLYVTFELCEKFGIQFGPPPTLATMSHISFSFFLRHPLTLFSTGGVYLPPLKDFSIFDRKTVSEGGESGM